MNKQLILIITFLVSAITSNAWADGPVSAYDEDIQNGYVNADGAVEDPQAPMSTTARAYRNGYIGGRQTQKSEDDARFAQYQQQQYQQAQQYQQPQYTEEEAPAYQVIPQVAGVARVEAYPPTRSLNDQQRTWEPCNYNYCSESRSGYSASVRPAPQPVYVQPRPVYVEPRVVLPPRFGYNRNGPYPLANGYRGYVPVRPQPAPRDPREVYYVRSY